MPIGSQESGDTVAGSPDSETGDRGSDTAVDSVIE